MLTQVARGRRLVEALEVSKSVTQLIVSGCRFGEEGGIEELCEFLSNKDHFVNHLCLRSCKPRRSDCQLIWNMFTKLKSLDICGNNLNELHVGDDLSSALVASKTLTELSLASNKIQSCSFWKSFAKALSLNTNLTSLDVSFNDMGDEGVTVLAEGLKNNRGLTVMNAASNGIGEKGAKSMGEVLKHNKSIVKLDLSFNRIAKDGIRWIASALKENNSIAFLNLYGNKLGSGGSVALFDALKTNRSMNSLFLLFNDLGMGDCCALAEALRSNDKLTYLNMSDNQLPKEGLMEIAHSLERNRSLQKIHFRNISAQVGNFFSMLLMHNSSVTEIELSDNVLEPESYRLIGEGLKSNQTLRKLILMNVALGQGGGGGDIHLIAEGVKSNSYLSHLALRKNNLKAEGAKAICGALEENKSVTSLDLKGSNLGQEGGLEVARMLLANKFLKWIELGENNFGNVAGRAIFDALRANSTLETLGIEGNMLGKECLGSLTQMLKSNDTLTALDFSKNKLEPKFASIFAKVIALNESLVQFNIKSVFDSEHVNVIAEALRKNRSLTYCGLQEEHFKGPCRANKHMRRLRIESSVITFTAIRRFRDCFLKIVPKEVVAMIAIYLLETKDDQKAWKVPNL